MIRIASLFAKLLKATPHAEKGQGLVEYALILVLVSVVVVGILSMLGPSVGAVFSNLVTTFDGDAVASEGEKPQDGDICQYWSGDRWRFRTYNSANGWEENGQWDWNSHDRPAC
jgi:pilus assembly protein Flp/PilA